MSDDSLDIFARHREGVQRLEKKRERERERIEKRESEIGRDGSSGGDSSRGNCGCDGASVGRRTHVYNHRETRPKYGRPSLTELEIGARHLRVNNNACETVESTRRVDLT